MFSSFVVIVIVIVLSVVDVILAADVATFTPIEFDFYFSISQVFIDLSRNGGSGPNTTMFTIFPSNEGDGITVETSPANLVTILKEVDAVYISKLFFEWNTEVSSTATSGGVRIGIPSDILKTIDVSGGHNAQILDGFTNIRTLAVRDDGSIIRASMLSLVSDTLYSLNSGGKMYVETNIPVTGESYVKNGGQTWIETPSFNYIRVENEGSQLNIKGDIDLRDGKVFDGGQLTVTGTITGTIQNGYDSYENKYDGNSTVNAPSCDNVISSKGSTCNAGRQIVDVDVSDLSQNTPCSQMYPDLSGQKYYLCKGQIFQNTASAVLPGYFATIAVVVVVTLATTAILI